MSDPNGSGKNGKTGGGSGPGTGPGESAKETQAEYLKPEDGKPRGSTKREKDPRTLEGKAEPVEGEAAAASDDKSASEKAEAPGSQRSPLPLVLAAGVAGLGGAAVALAAVWFVGLPQRAGDGDAFTGFEQRIDALEAGAGESATQTGATITSLGERIDQLEKDLAAASETPDSAVALRERIETLAADIQKMASALNDTRDSLRDLEQKVGGISESLPPPGIADQVGSIETLARALDLRLASLAPDVQKMEDRVARLEEEKDDPDAAARAALGLALANLARAAESAGSFETELDTVRTFLPGETALAGLAKAASGGVPTRAALEARFPALAEDIFDAARRADADGWWSRFVANAKSLVTIRKTGEISGDTIEAKVARMEERLKVHDLEGAVKEAETLEGPAAEAAASWLDDARARLETDRLVRELSASVAAQLAKTKG